MKVKGVSIAPPFNPALHPDRLQGVRPPVDSSPKYLLHNRGVRKFIETFPSKPPSAHFRVGNVRLGYFLHSTQAPPQTLIDKITGRPLDNSLEGLSTIKQSWGPRPPVRYTGIFSIVHASICRNSNTAKPVNVLLCGPPRNRGSLTNYRKELREDNGRHLYHPTHI